MNNLLLCPHARSSIDQDSITETNLADSPFHIRSQEESNINGFRVKSMRNGRTRYGSDSLLTMILRERSRANAETAAAAAAASSKDASPLSGGGQQSTLVGLPPEHENPSFSGSSPPLGSLLPFSGSIPRSGSISQSSNSTASTNSFAFPVLASEWNDSPVRMADADKRQRLKKTRWWGICFHCSRI